MCFFTFLFHPFQSPVGSGARANPWVGGRGRGDAEPPRVRSVLHPPPPGAVKVSGTEKPRAPGETALHSPQPHTRARAAGLRAQAPRVILPVLTVRTLRPPALESNLAFPGEGRTPVFLTSFPLCEMNPLAMSVRSAHRRVQGWKVPLGPRFTRGWAEVRIAPHCERFLQRPGFWQLGSVAPWPHLCFWNPLQLLGMP